MKNPWVKFYPSDWRSDPRLRMCTVAARGLWIEMLCLMHEANPYGHLLIEGKAPNDTQLAMLAGIQTEQVTNLLGELESAGVFSRSSKGVIYSRRMVRDEKRAKNAQKNGRNGGNPSLCKTKEISGLVNPEDNLEVKAQKPEAIYQKDIKEKNTKKENPELFDQFWELYPRKDGKGKAREKFKIALSKATPEELMRSVRKYSQLCSELKPEERQFIPHPATWLHQERWEDERLKEVEEPVQTEVSWESRMSVWESRRIWNENWGPEPGKQGCNVPQELLGELV
jgi:hypothetical protein